MHHSFVIISESNKHDTVAVNLYNKKMIQYLINIHGEDNVKKLIFFSDGAAGQYKNKSNFLNMTYLEKEKCNCTMEFLRYITWQGSMRWDRWNS